MTGAHEGECSGTVVVGRLIADGASVRVLRGIQVRAAAAETGAILDETTSATRGEFLLELPVLGVASGGGVQLSVTLQALDREGRVLVEKAICVSGGEPQVVLLELPAGALDDATLTSFDEAPRPLLNLDSLRDLRNEVAAFATTGELEAQAVDALEEGIRPLVWAAGLMDDAILVLSGDPDAAERLRAALLGLGIGPELPAGASTNEATEGHGDGAPGFPAGFHLVAPDALATLVAATAWAAEDAVEAQAMLNGLAVTLWSRPWLDLLLIAARQGRRGAMQPLMAGPGPLGGLPPGWGPKIPGLPGLPGGPGWANVPGKKKDRPPLSIIIGKSPELQFPINDRPSAKELCLVGALVAVERAKRAAPLYEIQVLSNPAACPGRVLRILGVNFGLTGSVIFPGKGSGVVATDVQLWSNTEIRVRVPDGAAPGEIRLSIYERTLNLCGRMWPIYRLGKTIPYFQGGIPAVLKFLVDGKAPVVIAAPDTDVTIAFTTSAGTAVIATVNIWNGPARLRQVTGLAGGTHTLTFRTPAVTSVTDLRVALQVDNRCGTSEESITLTVAQQPNLAILQVEVTQAIQRLDNSVRLAARRRTLVRVYLGSGLNKFSYTGDQLGLPGITGTVTLKRGGQTLAVVAAMNAPTTARALFFPYAREDLAASLNFMLPVEHLSGETTIEVRVWLETVPRGVECTFNNCDAARTLTLNFEPVRPISLVRILINDLVRGLPAPTLAQWQATLQGAMARFPVADADWNIRVMPGLGTISVLRDLTTEDGWDDLLEDIDDVAGDASDSWDHRWVGLVPADRGTDNLKLNGIGRSEVADRPWPLANDYLAMAVQAGLPATFAHELGHTFGSRHSGCPAGGPNMPADIDYSLPLSIEDHGIDLYTFEIYKRLEAGEIMSYCGGASRWVSIMNWHRFMDALQ